ncbi:hypothetical protein BDV93DRAFT_557669 [Ceratobasidium sp. AG-I]|nr:hypothetical protein BDV93DRAFT_557669 [Ceratobasidium sp. AG-I]
MILDGGHINVLSALIILRELLRRIQVINGLVDIPFPFEYFDIMAGTGMGGVMLILMGRLRLGIDLTLQYCVEILERVFKNRKWLSRDSVFSATGLETAVSEIVARHCGYADARMMDPECQLDGCKVMVCARTADAIRAGTTACIRTYRVSANQGPECTIVEAVRATTATPGMFKRAVIKEQGIAVSYVGGGLECNNPTDRLLADVSLVFPNQPAACVVSIGCGQLHSGNIPDSKIYDAFLPSKLFPVMQTIAMDCEKTHQDLARRFGHAKDVLSEVQAHTQAYLQDVSVNASMDSATKAASLKRGLVTLQSGNITPLKPKHSIIGRCPPSSRAFTGREDILEQMRHYFFEAPPSERRLFVLCGLGGAGKTQLALKFVQMHKDEFWQVFYIDATTRETISAGLATLAKEANVGETVENGLAWLVSQEERWLLVLNNADDPKLNLQEFFPACTHGDVLITTRNQQMRAHTHEPKSYCSVGAMMPEDALELMLKVSGAGGEDHEIDVATALVEELGYFALAIVQSGAYMRATQCGLAEYHRIFQAARECLLTERGTEQTDDYGMSLLHMMSFFHHEGISEIFFEAACAKAVSYEPKIPLSESQATTKAVIFEFLSSLRTPSGDWNPVALKGLTNQLRAFSLIDYNTHTCSYSMHPLVQEWSRTSMRDAAISRGCAAWVLALCVKMEYDPDSYAFRRRLLPHILALDLDYTQIVPDVARRLSLVYREAGYPEEEEALSAVALQASRDTLGAEDSITLACIQDLARALRRQGKFEEAVLLLTEGIEIERRVLGHMHPDTLSSMHTLAGTYSFQGRCKESEALFLEVIEARKRVIGAEHGRTLQSIGALASTYLAQGRLSEAEALQLEVLQKTQRVKGREHPDTLAFMHNLALTYKAKGKLRESKSLMEETVALSKQVRGESHIDTQSSVRELESIQRRMQSELVLARAC